MTDTSFSQESFEPSAANGETGTEEEPPRFGAVDIVEAFTAMRHEWRGQTKESRALAEQIQDAAANIQSLEGKLLTAISERPPGDTTEAKRLALLLVETDHQLSRAMTALTQTEENRRQREAAERVAVERGIASLNGLARWLARPLLALLKGQHSARMPSESSPALEGLSIVVTRLRRQMREQGIERLDVLGQPFDADTMHAIGTAAATQFPPGHVAEQLSPAYRWHDQLLCYADVRVAEGDRPPLGT